MRCEDEVVGTPNCYSHFAEHAKAESETEFALQNQCVHCLSSNNNMIDVYS